MGNINNNNLYNIKFKIFDKTCLDNQDNQVIISHLNAEYLLRLQQVHGNTVIDADNITDFSHQPEADAAITTKPGLVLSIKTADCVPVLLADNAGTIIGAAHCGWRSAKENILDNIIKKMRAKNAAHITAWIGPAIHQESYEVDGLFYNEIITSEPEAKILFKPASHPQKYLFDLPGFVKLKLKKLDISNIIDLCENTYSNPEKYYSYRRDTHLGIADNKARILSTIVMMQ